MSTIAAKNEKTGRAASNQKEKNMKSKLFLCALFIIFSNPMALFAETATGEVAGTYTTTVNNEYAIVLKLNPDRSAVIEQWIKGGAREIPGQWAIKGDLILLSYHGVAYFFEFHRNLSLRAYPGGRKYSARGLITSSNRNPGGLLASIKALDKDLINQLLEEGKIKLPEESKPGYINFISVFIFTFFLSAFLGKRNPFVFAIFSTAGLILLSYFLYELRYSSAAYIAFGFISCLVWSIFFRWLFLWDRMGPNDRKIKFLVGFSSGRGNRNTTIISQKGSRAID